MFKAYEVTVSEISNILGSAAIDHVIEPDDDIYVTGLPFNFWIGIDLERQQLSIRTYWNFLSNVSELEGLRCANDCNMRLVALQFFVGEGADSLWATQTIGFEDGLVRVALLRALRVFADVFHAAISEHTWCHLFEPISALSDDFDEYKPASSERLLN